MAMVGGVNVKFSAETAEYIQAVGKIKGVNREAEASAKSLKREADALRASWATPADRYQQGLDRIVKLYKAGAIGAGEYLRAVKELKAGMDAVGASASGESAMKKNLEVLAGGGVAALAIQGMEKLAASVAEVRKELNAGASGFEAFVSAAYKIPVTGSTMRVLDAIANKKSPEEQVTAAQASEGRTLDTRGQMIESSNRRLEMRFDAAIAEPGITPQYKAQLEERKAYAQKVNAIYEELAQANIKYEDASKAIVRATLPGGNGTTQVELDMLRVEQGLLEQLIKSKREEIALEEKRHKTASAKIDTDAFKEYMNRVAEGIRGGASGITQGGLDWVKAAEDAAKAFKDNREAQLDAESKLRALAIDRLSIAAQLGNADAKNNADRLRVEQQIADKRRELLRLANDPTLTAEQRKQAENELGALPQLQRDMLRAIRPQVDQHITATPQLSAQYTMNRGADAMPEKQYQEQKRANEIAQKVADNTAKIIDKVSNQFSVFSIAD